MASWDDRITMEEQMLTYAFCSETVLTKHSTTTQAALPVLYYTALAVANYRPDHGPIALIGSSSARVSPSFRFSSGLFRLL